MKQPERKPQPVKMSLLEKNLFGVPLGQSYTLLPGLVTAGLLAWLSIWLSGFIGTSVMGFQKSPISSVMMALLLGIIISNIVPLPAFLKPGLTFAVKKVLRLGIILLGIRLSIMEVFRLGVIGIPIVLLCITGALLITTFISRRLKLPERLGTLIAVGTSICGVSAIVATAPTIDAKEEEVTYAVAVITVFGLLATLVYPYLAHFIFAGDAAKVGLFLGTSVHDTSQVTGSALVYSDVFSQPDALDVAMVTKLVRNVFMVAVIPLMAFVYARKAAEEKGAGARSGKKISLRKMLPFFVLGFLLLALLRSIGDINVGAGARAFGLFDQAAWKGLYGTLKGWAVNLLVVALAGVGLSTRFSTLKCLGPKPFFVGLAAALLVGGVSFLAISLLGRFIQI